MSIPYISNVGTHQETNEEMVKLLFIIESLHPKNGKYGLFIIAPPSTWHSTNTSLTGTLSESAKYQWFPVSSLALSRPFYKLTDHLQMAMNIKIA